MHVTFLIKSALLLSTLLVCIIRPAAAQTAECPTARPSVRTAPDRIGEVRAYPAAAPADTLRSDTAAKRPGLIRRIIDYYSRSNVDRTFEKKIDWSIAPGPNYSSDVGFGIGFLLAGLYRLDRTDSVTAPSNVSIYGNFTTQKFVLLRFSGDNLFNHVDFACFCAVDCLIDSAIRCCTTQCFSSCNLSGLFSDSFGQLSVELCLDRLHRFNRNTRRNRFGGCRCRSRSGCCTRSGRCWRNGRSGCRSRGRRYWRGCCSCRSLRCHWSLSRRSSYVHRRRSRRDGLAHLIDEHRHEHEEHDIHDAAHDQACNSCDDRKHEERLELRRVLMLQEDKDRHEELEATRNDREDRERDHGGRSKRHRSKFVGINIAIVVTRIIATQARVLFNSLAHISERGRSREDHH